MQAPSAPAAQTIQQNILVAKQDIPIGTPLDETMYDVKPYDQQLIPMGAVNADDPATANVKGLITNTSIVTNQPILSSMLRNPNDPGYIAGQLGEGMRAVTISVGLTESIAGLVEPGDKVDVLYTHNISSYNLDAAKVRSLKSTDEPSEETANVDFTEVLIPNLKILAVDKRVGAAPADQQGNVPQSVTLEVNLRDAQKLSLAQKVGKLSLALRSIKDKDKYDIVRPTAEQDLSRTLPPAYFSNLYDSDATYDFGVVDPYSAGGPSISSKKSDGKIKLYRGSELKEVEVNKK